MQTLGLVPGKRRTLTTRVGFWRPKTVTREGELFEEWTVDGMPLQDILQRAAGSSTRPNEVSGLSMDDRWPEVAVATLRTLLGETPSDFDGGRVAVLVCSSDADLTCGAFSAELIIDNDVVRWRNVAWQVTREPLDLTEDGFQPPLNLEFAREPYERLLRQAMGRFLARTRSTKSNPYEAP